MTGTILARASYCKGDESLNYLSTNILMNE